MSTSTHALARTMTRIARDGVVDLEKQRAAKGFDELGELEQQFQLPLDARVGTDAVVVDFAVEFDVYFFEAQEQRDSPLTVPQFHSGAVLRVTDDNDADGGGVAYSIVVTDWVEDDRAAYIGAKLRLTLWRPPGAPAAINVEGYLHLSFQGYGAPSEDDDSPDIDTGT